MEDKKEWLYIYINGRRAHSKVRQLTEEDGEAHRKNGRQRREEENDKRKTEDEMNRRCGE
jgi:hypothetical protein